MKKIILFLCLFISALSYAQVNTEAGAPEFPQDIEKKYELKINALTLLAAKWIDVSYENLLNEESSFGVAATLNTDTTGSDLKYSLTPYYRRYFSSKLARGFFVEGFGMLFSAKDTDLFGFRSQEFETGVALGISVGGKFVSKQGFTTELLLGFGRNLSNDNHNDSIGRIGISFGYRF